MDLKKSAKIRVFGVFRVPILVKLYAGSQKVLQKKRYSLFKRKYLWNTGRIYRNKNLVFLLLPASTQTEKRTNFNACSIRVSIASFIYHSILYQICLIS